MKLTVRRARDFDRDFANQFAWYWDNAGETISRQFEQAVEITLKNISEQAALGRGRKFRHHRLHGLRSFRVSHPFEDILIFYRIEETFLHALRLIHGSRDLPHRLPEPPRA